jgi:hypothetical protein
MTHTSGTNVIDKYDEQVLQMIDEQSHEDAYQKENESCKAKTREVLKFFILLKLSIRMPYYQKGHENHSLCVE